AGDLPHPLPLRRGRHLHPRGAAPGGGPPLPRPPARGAAPPPPRGPRVRQPRLGDILPAAGGGPGLGADGGLPGVPPAAQRVSPAPLSARCPPTPATITGTISRSRRTSGGTSGGTGRLEQHAHPLRG